MPLPTTPEGNHNLQVPLKSKRLLNLSIRPTLDVTPCFSTVLLATQLSLMTLSSCRPICTQDIHYSEDKASDKAVALTYSYAVIVP